ncbi:MAG: hypothetical protein ACI8YQ_003547 [Polaribacter sp.]|jgi:hypothetical protein
MRLEIPGIAIPILLEKSKMFDLPTFFNIK